MIPKTIHYCWFGKKPLPKLAEQCIKSWKEFLPDYEIRLWNEDNFNVNIIPYTKAAYDAKKYAFVSDFARFWILYNYGGIYFDTDVELIAPLYPILENGAFMACEQPTDQWKENYPAVNAGLGLATERHNDIIKDVLDNYEQSSFITANGQLDFTTVVRRVSALLGKYNLRMCSDIQKCANISIYPPEYFCPINYLTGELTLTEKTVSIHHYMASWLPSRKKSTLEWIWEKLCLPNTNIRNRISSLIKHKK